MTRHVLSLMPLLALAASVDMPRPGGRDARTAGPRAMGRRAMRSPLRRSASDGRRRRGEMRSGGRVGSDERQSPPQRASR